MTQLLPRKQLIWEGQLNSTFPNLLCKPKVPLKQYTILFFLSLQIVLHAERELVKMWYCYVTFFLNCTLGNPLPKPVLCYFVKKVIKEKKEGKIDGSRVFLCAWLVCLSLVLSASSTVDLQIVFLPLELLCRGILTSPLAVLTHTNPHNSGESSHLKRTSERVWVHVMFAKGARTTPIK